MVNHSRKSYRGTRVPKLSFVVPAYNSAHTLAETISSLQVQTVKDIEIVVVDDHSTDDTEHLMKYLCKDKRIKYKRLPKNIGRSKTRNIGNAMASSKIICVNDADDISFRQRARTTINAMKKCDVFYSSFCIMDALGRIQEQVKASRFDIEKVKTDPFHYTYICHSSMAYKKGVKYSTGVWSDLGIDDWKLQIDLCKKGYKFGYSSKLLVAYRMSSANIELTRNNKKVMKLKRGIIENI